MSCTHMGHDLTFMLHLLLCSPLLLSSSPFLFFYLSHQSNTRPYPRVWATGGLIPSWSIGIHWFLLTFLSFLSYAMFDLMGFSTIKLNVCVCACVCSCWFHTPIFPFLLLIFIFSFFFHLLVCFIFSFSFFSFVSSVSFFSVSLVLFVFFCSCWMSIFRTLSNSFPRCSQTMITSWWLMPSSLTRMSYDVMSCNVMCLLYCEMYVYKWMNSCIIMTCNFPLFYITRYSTHHISNINTPHQVTSW